MIKLCPSSSWVSFRKRNYNGRKVFKPFNRYRCAPVAQSEEHNFRKVGVMGANPIWGFLRFKQSF